jgi:SAM-dependent methyltransferase
MSDPDKFEPIRNFYDQDYYAEPSAHGGVSWHDRAIAARLGELRGARVLDVACGLGQWLGLLEEHGAEVAGIDISARAIEHCRQRFPGKEFHVGPAETLPFADGSFDLVTCMGSLEHFLDKPAALREMVRVSRPDARFLILVPNAGFLTRRLGLYGGTQQAKVSEDVYPLARWEQLLRGSGLHIEHRWRDLHTLSRSWIMRGPAWGWPLRALQAAALPLWPMAWQYQVHHYCRRAGQS